MYIYIYIYMYIYRALYDGGDHLEGGAPLSASYTRHVLG